VSGKEQFVKLPRDLLESDAFRSLGINAFRVVHFLMIEHMRCGGRQNDHLKAPHRQLVAFGIPKDCITAAIHEAEGRGLIECHRHGLRIATTYTLTWLPLHDGGLPSNAWREYRSPQRRATRQAENLPPEVGAGLPPEVGADGPNLPPEVGAEPSGNLPPEVGALSRKESYQDGGNWKVREEEGSRESVRGEPVEVRVEGQGYPAGKPEPMVRERGEPAGPPNGRAR
jgi:hypothetical protein